jgi:hypothetical protein
MLSAVVDEVTFVLRLGQLIFISLLQQRQVRNYFRTLGSAALLFIHSHTNRSRRAQPYMVSRSCERRQGRSHLMERPWTGARSMRR